jgi:hypothetical protein
MTSGTLSVKKPATGGATVIVASKLPMPLILQIHRKVKKYEAIPGVGGVREFEQFEADANLPTYTIAGNSHPQNRAPLQQIQNNFGLTFGIPKDFWDMWLEQNAAHEAVKNGLIFAMDDQAGMASKTKDHANIRSGLERLNPDDLKRYGVEKSDEKQSGTVQTV